MAERDTVTKWHTAICLLEAKKFEEAAAKLLEIDKPRAEIIYNLGCISMLQSAYSDAIQYFNRSTEQNKYLALAYYQRGICYHEVQRNDRAELDFLTAQSMVHSDGINYKQLGAEVILTSQLLDQCVAITRDTYHSKKHMPLPTLPLMSCIFRPQKAKVDNLVKHDFLERAKVISSTKQTDIIYAAGKKQEQQANNTNPGSTSLPSTPLSRRHHPDASKATKLLIPPPPRRPPPRLSKETLAAQDFRTKSKSCEDVTVGDNIYEDIDEDSCTQPVPEASPGTSRFAASYVNLATSDGHKTFSSQASASFRHSTHSSAKGAEQNPKMALPQCSINQVRLPPSSQQGTGLHNRVEKPLQRPVVASSASNTTLPGLHAKEQSSTSDAGKSVSNRVHPSSLGASPNHHGNSGQGQGQEVGHIAQMKSLFERNDSSVVASGHVKPERVRGPHQNGMRQSVTQSLSAPVPITDSVLPKSPKPARPPPPKFSK